MAAHEIERLKVVSLGDRRACRKGEHQACAHKQQEADEHQTVDGEPPVGEDALVGAGDPHAALPSSVTLLTPSRPMTMSRKASPRLAKLANWSYEAQAGDRSTTGSGASEPAASAAASATARPSVAQMTWSTAPPSWPEKSSAASPIR